MRMQEYTIVDQAVEEGIQRGWERAHKYTTDPDVNDLYEELRAAIMLALTEVITFELGFVEES